MQGADFIPFLREVEDDYCSFFSLCHGVHPEQVPISLVQVEGQVWPDLASTAVKLL